MAALIRRECRAVARILSGISHLGPTSGGSCAGHKSHLIKSHPPQTFTSSIHTSTAFTSAHSSITATEEPDALYQKVSVLVKSHDRAVLDSYEFFTTMAAKELGIKNNVFEPSKDIERLTLLKSIHIYKKHRVQYETRTHYRCFELFHLTGSTARVYLEYIQRNLPEGVAMQVTKTSMEKIPDHILKPIWKGDEEEAQPVKTNDD